MGHPDGGGARDAAGRGRRGGEYLTDGSGAGPDDDDADEPTRRTRSRRTSTVGTGNSKWVVDRRVEFRPWKDPRSRNSDDDEHDRDDYDGGKDDDCPRHGRRAYGRKARSEDTVPPAISGT